MQFHSGLLNTCRRKHSYNWWSARVQAPLWVSLMCRFFPCWDASGSLVAGIPPVTGDQASLFELKEHLPQARRAHILLHRRKFRSQTSDKMDRWKAEMERVREEKRREEKKEDKRRQDPGARKGRKVAKHCVFPLICGSGGSKSRLAKAAGAEQSGQMRDEQLHAVVAWSTFAKAKTPHVRSTFGSWDDGKVHAVVAQSTFRSENVQSTPCSDHVWKLTCRKSARHSGAKRMLESKALKLTVSDHFWKLTCRKSARRCVAKGYGALLDVRMLFCVAGTRESSPGQKWAKREGFVAVSTTTTTLQLQLQLQLHYTTLHSLHYAKLHYTTLHSTRLHSTPLRYTTLHYTTPHYTTLHHTTLHHTTFNYTTLH